MKKYLLILLSIFLVLFSSCNPDSNTSIFYDMLHAAPTSDYRINTYVGDYSDKEIVLGTDLGIILYDVSKDTDKYTVLVGPVARPQFLVKDDNDSIYVVYYEQNNGQSPQLKAADIASLLDDAVEDVIIDNITLSIVGCTVSNPVITNFYAVHSQGPSGNSISYTAQIQEDTPDSNSASRSIEFYMFSDSQISFDGSAITITPSYSASATSTYEVAPYIVGDGYIAYIDANESYYNVYDIRNGGQISSGSSNYVARNTDEEIIAYFREDYNGYDIMADNSGNVFTRTSGDNKDAEWTDQGDFGSFPLDNRRAALSTEINGSLYIGYKYGPEILEVSTNDENKLSLRATDVSAVNDEDILGIKYYNDNYYVITEQSEVIRCALN